MHIVDLVGRGLLEPVIDRVLPLHDVAAGHAALGGAEAFGKVILVPGETP